MASPFLRIVLLFCCTLSCSVAPLALRQELDVEPIVGHSNPAMTRHYTHIGEVAAGLAVAALPTVIGEAPQASTVDGDGPEAVLTKLRGILEGLGAENWVEKRGEALALLSS